MKTNRVKSIAPSKPEGRQGFRKITIEIPDHEHTDIQRVASILGATVEQTTEAILAGHAEDYLSRQSDDLWELLIEYIGEVYGNTPRLKLCQRFMDASRANSRLPSVAERARLYDNALKSVDSYATYLVEIGAPEQDIDNLVTS